MPRVVFRTVFTHDNHKLLVHLLARVTNVDEWYVPDDTSRQSTVEWVDTVQNCQVIRELG